MSNYREKIFTNLALVPARGGSKSIPYKNIVNLGGRPLISYCLEAIKRSRYIDRVIVTTDDEKIAEVSRDFGAETPFTRPKELAQDGTPTIPVIEHALLWLEKEEGCKPDYVLLVQPTSPFVKTQQIDDAFELMIEKNADSAVTLIPCPRIFHPYHVRHITEEGYLEFDNPELHYKHPNRQSDPKRFAFGNLYWFKREIFLKNLQIEVGQRVGLEIEPTSAHDIDGKSDLQMAEFIISKRLND